MWLHKEQRAHESDLRGYHELFETIFPHLNWREALAEARCHVLTFNYDRLFEMAFLRRYPQFDPNGLPLYGQQVLNSGFDLQDRHKIDFAQDRFCFLKLHGSAGMWLRRHDGQVEHFFGVPVSEPGLRINDTHFYANPQTHCSRQTLKAEPLIVFPHEKGDALSESGTRPLYREYIRKVWEEQAGKVVAGASKIIIVGCAYPFDTGSQSLAAKFPCKCTMHRRERDKHIVGYSFDPNDRRWFMELLNKRQSDCKVVVWNLNADALCENLLESYPGLVPCKKRF